jgi:ubiquinone/menaquinone biosynthesis C-methylase UbiE
VATLKATTTASPTKDEIRTYWEAESCGVRYGEGQSRSDFYRTIEETRYRLEPCIPEFARFQEFKSKKILEIGVGAGTDFHQWIKAGAVATGVDLTAAGIDHTARRLELAGVKPGQFALRQADAEALPFKDDSFDLVYSWGVLHCTPDTPKAFQEACRVVKPGAPLKAMVYHARSWTAWILWLVYGLGRGRPWRSPKRVVFERLESPGTKVYTRNEARRLVEKAGFENVRVRTVLGPGDLLLIKPSWKYKNPAWKLVWALYPRWLVRMLGDRFGLYLLIEARKPVL